MKMSEEEYTPADEALDCARQIALTAKTSDFCYAELKDAINKKFEDWNVFEFYIELSDGIAVSAQFDRESNELTIGEDIDDEEDEDESIIIQMIFKPQDDENEEEEE